MYYYIQPSPVVSRRVWSTRYYVAIHKYMYVLDGNIWNFTLHEDIPKFQLSKPDVLKRDQSIWLKFDDGVRQ